MRICLDIETNGFEPDRIWCVGTEDLDTGETHLFLESDRLKFKEFMKDVEEVMGFNLHIGTPPAALPRILGSERDARLPLSCGGGGDVGEPTEACGLTLGPRRFHRDALPGAAERQARARAALRGASAADRVPACRFWSQNISTSF